MTRHIWKCTKKTFAYAAKINAAFVVVHSNEAWHFAGEKLAVQELVCSRIENCCRWQENTA